MAGLGSSTPRFARRALISVRGLGLGVLVLGLAGCMSGDGRPSLSHSQAQSQGPAQSSSQHQAQSQSQAQSSSQNQAQSASQQQTASQNQYQSSGGGQAQPQVTRRSQSQSASSGQTQPQFARQSQSSSAGQALPQTGSPSQSDSRGQQQAQAGRQSQSAGGSQQQAQSGSPSPIAGGGQQQSQAGYLSQIIGGGQQQAQAESQNQRAGGAQSLFQAGGRGQSAGGGQPQAQLGSPGQSAGGGQQQTQAGSPGQSAGGGQQQSEAGYLSQIIGGGQQQTQLGSPIQSTGGGQQQAQAGGTSQSSGGGQPQAQLGSLSPSFGGGQQQAQAGGASQSSGGGQPQAQLGSLSPSFGGGQQQAQAGGAIQSGGGGQPQAQLGSLSPSFGGDQLQSQAGEARQSAAGGPPQAQAGSPGQKQGPSGGQALAHAHANNAGAVQSQAARSSAGRTQTQAARQSSPDQAARARRKSERGSFLAETAAHLQRLDRVSFPILAKNAEFCRKKQAPLTGLRIWNVAYFDELEPGVMAPGEDRDTVWQEAARDTLGLGEAPQVLSVGAGSPAEKAGLRVDDVILAINGETIEPSPKAAKRARNLLEEAVGDGWSPVYIEYGRSGRTGQAVLEPVIGCKQQMLVDPREEVAAWADRKRVTVTYGMMKLARTDKELAYVVSRELAHSLFGDDRRDQRRTQDAAEADYLGSYFYARAGYPVQTSDHHGIRQAWHLMRHAQPVELGLKGHAPTLTKRAAMVNEAAAEIESKQASQQALIPGDAESWVEARLRAPEPTGGPAPSPAPGSGESLAARTGSGQVDQPTGTQGGSAGGVPPGVGGGGTERTSKDKAARRQDARRRKPRVVNESPADVTDVETVDAYNRSLPDVPDILRVFERDSADRL